MTDDSNHQPEQTDQPNLIELVQDQNRLIHMLAWRMDWLEEQLRQLYQFGATLEQTAHDRRVDAWQQELLLRQRMVGWSESYQYMQDRLKNDPNARLKFPT